MLMTAVLQWGFASATQKAPLWSHHRNSSFWVKCSFDFLLKHFSNSSCPKFSFLRGSWVMRNFAFFHHNEVFFSGKKANSKGELSGEGLVMGHSGTPLPKCSQAVPIHSAWCKSQLCSRSCQNYFTPFKTEHLLGHKEWPDHVGIKILTRDLELYTNSFAVMQWGLSCLRWCCAEFVMISRSLKTGFWKASAFAIV